MGNSLEFSRLFIFKPNHRLGVDVDDQVCEFVKSLKGKIKENWQILSPSPTTRVLYFEMQDTAIPEQIKGYQKDLRETGTPKYKSSKSSNKENKK